MLIRKDSILRLLLAAFCMVCSPLLAMDSKIAKDQADAKKKENDRKLAVDKVTKAIKNNDLAEVERYINAGGDVNAKNSQDRTLLHTASWPGASNIEAARLLLIAGAKINSEAAACVSLRNAIGEANHELIALLLEPCKDAQGRVVVSASGIPVLKYYEDINEIPSHLYSPLTCAVSALCDAPTYGRRQAGLKIVELLKHRGADFNAKDDAGDTSLSQAVPGSRMRFVVYRNLFIAKALIRWGASYQDPRLPIELDIMKKNAKDYNDKDELEAIETMRSYIDERRAQPPQDATAACLSVLGRSTNKESACELERAMTDFIQGPESADAMVRDGVKDAIARGSTFERNQEPMLEWIIGKDDKEPIADETGYTSLLYAVYRGNQKAVKVLLLLDPDLGARTISRQTAQMIADQQFKATGEEVFRTIKEMVNDAIVKRDKEEESQKEKKLKKEQERIKQEEANAWKNIDIVKQAIGTGASNLPHGCLNQHTVNKRYDKDLTPLLHAAWLGRTKIAEQLLKAGAKIDDRDNDYRTPLMRAALSGHVAVVMLLCEHMTAQQIAMTASQGKTAHDLVQDEAARVKKLYEERPLPEYEQKLKKYEQIMMILDV